MNRQQIVAEIKRLAVSNAGQPPGRQIFSRETGVKMSDWYPHIWLRWGDALAEAGYAPNQLQARASDEVLIERYIELVRELGKLPVEGEIRRKARGDKSFPSHTAFNRFGGKDKLLGAVAAHCRKSSGFEDVLGLCVESENTSARASAAKREREPRVITEFVYLMKSGRHYKIGRTNSVGRRGSELAIKIPVPPKTIHRIETDDPIGVEGYWHKAVRRQNAEKANGLPCRQRT